MPSKIVAAFILLFAACDPCENENCSGNGTPYEVPGENKCVCDCLPGFSGSKCETENRCITHPVPCDSTSGYCVDGVCRCYYGYEGSDCAILSRHKYIGGYQAAEVCITGGDTVQRNYLPFIYAGDGVDEFVIYHLGNNLLTTVKASLVSPYAFTIPLQYALQLPDNTPSGIEFTSGQVTFDTLTTNLFLEYEYIALGTQYQCSAVFTRR